MRALCEIAVIPMRSSVRFAIQYQGSRLRLDPQLAISAGSRFFCERLYLEEAPYQDREYKMKSIEISRVGGEV